MAHPVYDGKEAVAIIQNLPVPGHSGIDRTLQHWTIGMKYNAIKIRHGAEHNIFSP